MQVYQLQKKSKLPVEVGVPLSAWQSSHDEFIKAGDKTMWPAGSVDLWCLLYVYNTEDRERRRKKEGAQKKTQL